MPQYQISFDTDEIWYTMARGKEDALKKAYRFTNAPVVEICKVLVDAPLNQKTRTDPPGDSVRG